MEHQTQGEIDFGFNGFIEILWRARWLVISAAVTLAVAAGIAAKLMPKTYKAVTVLSPVSSNSEGGQLGGLGSVVSQFGGLAALAGISVTGDDKKAESIAVLQSEALTRKFIADNNLLPVLFDKARNSEQADGETKGPSAPTLWTANAYFKKKIRTVTRDAKTGLVTLEIAWKDPVQAADWANGLVKLTNVYLRDKAIAESEGNIAYLSEQAAKTDAVGVKQAIYTIMQAEINKAMLARGSEEYALKVIDPAVAPETHSSPQFLIWVVGGFFGGLFLSVLVALLRALVIAVAKAS